MARRVLTSICLLLASTSAAVAAVPMSLALAKAYVENPRLEAARARLRAVDETVPQARAIGRPAIEAVGGLALNRVETNDDNTTLQTKRTALTAEQLIYSGGEVEARLDTAQFLVMAERARLEGVEQDVLLESAIAFTNVVRDQEMLELALANERSHLQELDSVRQRYRLGELTVTDVAQAETRHARAVAERERTEGALRVAGAEYDEVIGDPPGTLLEPGLPTDLPGSEAEALSFLDATPEVRAAEFDLDASKSDIEIALSAIKPRLTLNGRAGYVDEPSTLIGWQRELSIGAQMTLPLYRGGGDQSRIRQSKQVRNEQRFRVVETRRAANAAITTAWDTLATTRARLRSLKIQERASRLALDGVRSEAETGLRTVLDVLDAEQEQFEARMAFTKAKYDEITDAYRLQAAVGSLTAANLGLDATLYDPQVYYEEIQDAWFGTRVSDGFNPQIVPIKE